MPQDIERVPLIYELCKKQCNNDKGLKNWEVIKENYKTSCDGCEHKKSNLTYYDIYYDNDFRNK